MAEQINTRPNISVLMPVYNAEKTIKQAIWSVLNQSVEEFELLIYLDGCTDSSPTIIEGFNDPRIKIFSEKENKGIVFGRNFLAEKAKGKFIVWLDADDYMLPERLAAQYNYLEVHPDVFMLGSWVEVRNDKKVKKVRWPEQPELIKAWMFFRNPLVQSSLMVRNEKGIILFDPDFEYLEDYKFYSSVFLEKHIAIYPAYLTSYYQDSQTELIHKYRHYDFVGKLEKIMQGNFALLQLNTGRNELSLIREFIRSNHKIKATDARIIRNFLNNAITQNRKLKVFQPTTFETIIYFQFLRLLKNAGVFNAGVLLQLLMKPLTSVRALFAGPKYK